MTSTLEELVEEISKHEEWMLYHLSNRKQAEETGANRTAERNLDDAAKHAAIATALRAIAQEQ